VSGPQLAGIVLSTREFRLFQSMLHRLAGISLSDAKQPMVGSRLAKRVRQYGLRSYGEYFELLMSERDELQTALDLLTTNETYFFREPEHFDFLREQVLPGMRARPLVRIWSGACSSGEEPYSIAMIMAEVLGERPWEVLASDLSTRVLEQARAGIYPLKDAADIPRPLLHKYCLKGIGAREGSFAVAPELRSRLHFLQVNLNAALPALGECDAIFLRNVMIYFDQDTKRQVVQRMLPLLRPGGYFFVSHSESLNGISSELEFVAPSIYRKPNA
jgi:chemotaxis protein methyltransferase CheR